MDYKEKYNEWLSNDFIDEDTKSELKNIEDEKEIEDRFYRELEFGTAGMRGVIGAGTNRMNKYTVMKATQGVANYINKKGIENPSVAISYDSRYGSTEFSKEAALVLNANGIKTYLVDELRPTPVLSFMVRELKTTAGIMMTASHNPAEYNGYKLYWSDGCQIASPVDKEIMNEINSITDYNTIETIDEEDARSMGLFCIVGKEIDDRFIEEIKKQSLNKDLCTKHGGDINIIYTPIHGTGNKLVRRVLSELGFTNVEVVKEQELPDPSFSTVAKPNPEFKEVYELGIKMANDIGSDVIIATDPDADRLGMMVRDKTGEFKLFTGNMIGSLLCEYILDELKRKSELKGNEIVVKSIVSTNLVERICESYNVELVNVLTGFKYIGDQMNRCESGNGKNFVFGFEESYGYIKGDHARDKDAVVISMLVAELMAVCREREISIFEYMENLYSKHGYYEDLVTSTKYPGIEGAEVMQKIMADFRENPKSEIGGIEVEKFIDYKNDVSINMKTKETEKTGLPEANVLFYKLVDGSFVCVRPSGTEPLIKYYFSIKGENKEEAKNKLENIKKEY